MSSLVDNESLFSLMQKAEECEQEVQAARHVAYVADEAYKKARLRADAAQLAVNAATEILMGEPLFPYLQQPAQPL